MRRILIDGFSKHPGSRDGYQSTCKVCNRRLVNKKALRDRIVRNAATLKDTDNTDYEEALEVDFIENISETDFCKDVSMHVKVCDL